MQPAQAVLALLLLAAPAAANPIGGEEPISADAPPPIPATNLHGVLVAHEGSDAFASAPSWATFFRPGEVRFAPATASTGGESVPDLGLALESVRRGDSLVLAGTARPRVEGDRVVYSHRGFEEVYDALPQGLEQSFVFATPPAGRGELVVRLRLDTDLVPASVHADSIVLEHAGTEVARIGAVLGIDADGREAPGELRLDGDRLDLVLPADFVDTATYPLVLDPLIVPPTSIPATGAADDDPDVAWDADTLRFCVVWRRDYSSTKSITLAQLFDISGAPIGPIASLGWSFAFGVDPADVEPAVCNVAQSDLFLIASGERGASGDRVRVTAMSAHDMSMRFFRIPAPRVWHLDIGGEGVESETTACLVWNNERGLFGRRIFAESIDELSPIEEEDLVLAGGYPFEEWELWTNPRISQTAGRNGNWLVVWEHWTMFHSSNVEACVVERSGTVSPIFPLTTTGTARWPSCDGDGEHFLVAYVGDGASEVRGALLHVVSPGVIAWGWDVPLVGTLADPAFDPQVAQTYSGGQTYTLSVRRTGDFPVEYRTYTPTLEEFYAPTTVVEQGVTHRIASLYTADFDAPTGIFALAIELPEALARAVATP